MTAEERGVALLEDALVLAQALTIGGGKRGAGAVEVRTPLAHGPVHDAEPVGRVDARLEAAGIVAGRYLALVEREGPLLGRPSKRELGLAFRGHGGALDLQPGRAAPDDLPKVVGPEGAAAGEKAHRLEQGGLALGVRAEEHVQPRT